MLQLERLEQVDKLLCDVYEEMLNGYIEEDLMQTAVDIQITVNRMVWKLNKTYYGASSDLYEGGSNND